MEDLNKWVVDNWADIVDFFDKLWAFVKELVLG